MLKLGLCLGLDDLVEGADDLILEQQVLAPQRGNIYQSSILILLQLPQLLQPTLLTTVIEVLIRTRVDLLTKIQSHWYQKVTHLAYLVIKNGTKPKEDNKHSLTKYGFVDCNLLN